MIQTNYCIIPVLSISKGSLVVNLDNFKGSGMEPSVLFLQAVKLTCCQLILQYCAPWLQCSLSSCLPLCIQQKCSLQLWANETPWDPSSLTSSFWCVVWKGKNVKRSDSELLCCSIQYLARQLRHPCLYVGLFMVAAPISLEHNYRQLSGCHNQGIKKITLGLYILVFSNKDDALTGDNPQALSGGEQSFCFYFCAKQSWHRYTS